LNKKDKEIIWLREVLLLVFLIILSLIVFLVLFHEYKENNNTQRQDIVPKNAIIKGLE
jgi:hypothetical protein